MMQPSQLGAERGIPGHDCEATETEGKKSEIEHDGALLCLDRTTMRAVGINSRCGRWPANIRKKYYSVPQQLTPLAVAKDQAEQHFSVRNPRPCCVTRG